MPIVLRNPGPEDEAAFLRAAARSRDAHRPWVSAPDSRDAFIKYLDKYSADANIALLAVEDRDGYVGCIHLNEIVRGPFRSAYLGYYGFTPFIGKGLMKQAMTLAINQAFGPIGLHRLEANIQPGNIASIALVRSLKFRHEGFSPHYLYIDGKWRDHERFAITTEDWTHCPPNETS